MAEIKFLSTRGLAQWLRRRSLSLIYETESRRSIWVYASLNVGKRRFSDASCKRPRASLCNAPTIAIVRFGPGTAFSFKHSTTLRNSRNFQPDMFQRVFSTLPSAPGTSKPLMNALIGAISAFSLVWFGRYGYDHIFKDGKVDARAPVHPDKSMVKTQIASQVQVSYQDQSGRSRIAKIEGGKLDEFLDSQIETLRKEGKQLEKEAEEILSKQLEAAFMPMKERASRFADWYFRYSTGYKLLSIASSTSLKHAVSLGTANDAENLKEAVQMELQRYLQDQYQQIVLRPELSDHQLQQAFTRTLQSLHHQYLETISTTERKLMRFLAEKTTHCEEISSSSVVLELDWTSQRFKVKDLPAHYEKNPQVTAALVVGGGFAGKAMGTAVVKAAMGKFAAPFVAKGVAAASSGAAGAAVGAIGGPIGSLSGAAIGVGVDYLLNAGVEVMHRDEFIADIHEVLQATQNEWKMMMLEELQRIVRVWMSDAKELLIGYAKEIDREG